MGALDRTYPKNPSIKERRRRYRYPVHLEATLWPKVGTSQKVQVIDLSVDGAGIEPSKPIDVGSTGVLRIDTSGGSLRLPYAVVRVADMSGLKRAGLCFYLMDAVRLQLAAMLDAMAGG